MWQYSWFAVHCTSMNNTNNLISGDNKGYASYLMEKYMNNGALPGQVSGLYFHCMLVIMLVLNFLKHGKAANKV